MNPLPGPCPYTSPEMSFVGDRVSHCMKCHKNVHDLRGYSLLSVMRFVKDNPTACIIMGGATDEAPKSNDSRPTNDTQSQEHPEG